MRFSFIQEIHGHNAEQLILKVEWKNFLVLSGTISSRIALKTLFDMESMEWKTEYISRKILPLS